MGLMSSTDASSPGTLILLGGEGLRPPASTSLWERIGALAPRDQPVVIVPVALAARRRSAVERRVRLAQKTLESFGLSTRVVMIFNAAQANDPALIAPLEEATCLYLPGGEARTLCEVMQGSAAWRVICARVRVGVPLVAGAGAAVALGEWAFAPRKPYPQALDALEFDVFPGLGLLPGVIVLPYANRLQPQVEQKITAACPPDVAPVTIDEEAALLVRGDQWEIIGDGLVSIRGGGPGRSLSVRCEERTSEEGLSPPAPPNSETG